MNVQLLNKALDSSQPLIEVWTRWYEMYHISMWKFSLQVLHANIQPHIIQTLDLTSQKEQHLM